MSTDLTTVSRPGVDDEAVTGHASRVRLEAQRRREVALGGEDFGRCALRAAQFPFLVGFVGLGCEPVAGEGRFQRGGDPTADPDRRDQAHAFVFGGLLGRGE